MTWLSDRSGIASIGVDVSAHHPQPARPRYRTTTMNRFFSATSMSRLIMSHNTRHVARVHARTYAPGHGVRADTRRLRMAKRGRRRGERASVLVRWESV